MAKKRKRGFVSGKTASELSEVTPANDDSATKKPNPPVVHTGAISYPLKKLYQLANWQAAFIIAAVGLAVSFDGLRNPFQGDDSTQIVTNIPVHAITNIRLFFEGSTFYNGQGLAPLIGAYYRPLMTTVFSLIYSVFGAQPVAYHLTQLSLYLASAFLLYLIFRYSFSQALALLLALVYVVHPLNSQVIFAIPSMQDALFVFFGLLALWLLLRFSTVKSLLLVAVCLLLSLFSKETGVIFLALSALYLVWFNRDRLYAFLGIMALPTTLYLALKIHAVGFAANRNIAPIDGLHLGSRLLTAPSILLFFITKFIFPWRLASAYYWTYPSFSIVHVLFPLIVDLAVIGLFVYLGHVVHARLSKAHYLTYLFFATWATLGVLPYLQIIPLDMTVSETWFYCSMAGVLGMIGIIAMAVRLRPSHWMYIGAMILIAVLGIRTEVRGFDYRTQYSLARSDIVASPEDYSAYKLISYTYYNEGNYRQAQLAAQRSIDIYPTPDGYDYLGLAYNGQHNYAGAEQAFLQGMKYGNFSALYDNLAAMIVAFGGDQSADKQYLDNSIAQFPQDSTLWSDLAIFDATHGDPTDAKVAIAQAAKFGPVNQSIYNGITNGTPVVLNLPAFGKSISIP